MSVPHSRKNLLLIVCVCSLLAGATVDAAGDDQFVYSGFTGANLTLDDAAVVTAAGLLELTNGTLRQKAHAIHPAPFRFREARNSTSPKAWSFSASFVFGILCPDPDACGHGIVLFVAPGNYNLSAASPSQYLGLANDTTNGDADDHLFGVELDTDQNNEFRDINGNHASVDVDSLVSVSSATAGYYDGGGFRNLTQVWVDYDGEGKRVNVSLAPLRMAKPVK